MRARLTTLIIQLQDREDFKKIIKMENRKKKARKLRVGQ